MNDKNFALTVTMLLAIAILAGCGGPRIPPDVKPNASAVREIRTKLASVSTGAETQEVQIEFGNEFATLKGTITLNGAAPQNPPMNITKDLGVCKPGGAAVLNEIVTVGANGGLANVLVYADVPDEWCHQSMIGGTGELEFDQKNCVFLNRIFPMQTTQKLRILNSDPIGHNAAMTPGNRSNPSFNQTIPSGGSALYGEGGALKQEKSPFPVSCSVHPWMQAFMIFRGNGYFAVTGEDGSFELANLPAGVPVKVNVWHEATKAVPGDEVSVEPGGIAEGWGRRGSFTVNLTPDSQTELKIAVNSSVLSK